VSFDGRGMDDQGVPPNLIFRLFTIGSQRSQRRFRLCATSRTEIIAGNKRFPSLHGPG
jgi:hypothetical protein